jgi:catechol 2,3-dioxygenase
MDLEETLVHYRDRIGLDVVGHPSGDRVYLRAPDEFDRHSIVLRKADSPGVDFIGFKVAREEDLDHFKARLEAMGIQTTEIPAEEDPGVGRRIRFTLPGGHSIDLYAHMDLSNDGPMVRNPDVWRKEPRGMRPIRFDHCFLNGNDVAGSVKIFTDALDFAVTEELVDEEQGVPLAVFLSCGTKAHDLAIGAYPEAGKLHHISFLLESWYDVGNAADIISRYNISLDIGPTRHGITRGQTIYFFDPSGNRNETFSGGYHYYPDNPKRRWSADEAGKAIFYYEKQLNDRFMQVST